MLYRSLFLILLITTTFQVAPLEARPTPTLHPLPPCLGCHSNLRGKNYLHDERYKNSVHGELSCVACHSPSRVASTDPIHRDSLSAPPEPASPPPEPLQQKTRFPDALASCQVCHKEIYTAVRQSVHGTALFEKKNADAAFCINCHRPIHYMKPNSELSSSVARTNLIDTCSQCHANQVIASRYNLNVYVVQAYKAHFHGKKYTLGGQQTPTCIDCHGHHAIIDADDPSAPVSPKNKVALCASCHTGATPQFAEAFTHTPLNAQTNPISVRIRSVLIFFLIFFVLLLSLHLLLDVASQFRLAKVKKRLPHVRKDIPWSLVRRLPLQVERMDLHMRIQHAILFIAVFYLAASGLALKFPDLRFSQAWIQLWGGVENAGHLHRFAALVLILDALYHLIYLFVQGVRRKIGFKLLPKPQDFKDLIKNLRYLSGRSEERPHFGAFSYIQKLDYWMVVFVVLVMIITGMMYWFPTVTARLLPYSVATWIWGAAYVVHSYEALLILFFAFVWHFYNVHLRSRVFPMSWVWLTGKIDLEDLMEEHPEEFEALLEVEKEKADASRQNHGDKQ